MHLFEWPSSGDVSGTGKAGAGSAAADGVTPGDAPERASLVAYLNAVLGPGVGNEWVVRPAATAAAAADYDDTNFLSIPSGGSLRRGSGNAAAGGGVPSSQCGGIIQGGAPSAAICISEAVKSGAPSLGLRVILEIVRPAAAAAASASAEETWPLSNGYSRKSATPRKFEGCSDVGDVLSSRPAAAAGGASGQAALYRAIAVLVAANRRSPLTRPVVVLTDLQGCWKLLWLGGARPGMAQSREDGDARREEVSNDHAAAMMTVAVDGDGDGDGGVDVFVWRMSAADAASVVRSMLREEAVDWDGQVSWTSPRRPATTATTGLGEGDREFNGPMAALRDRHLVEHYCRRRRHYSRLESSAATNNCGNGAAEENVAHAMSPPLAMEMALRMGGSSSFTGHSLLGQRTATVSSLGELGMEHQPRESRSFSSGLERTLGEMGARDERYLLDGGHRQRNGSHLSGRQSTNSHQFPNDGDNPSPSGFGNAFLGSSPRANGGDGPNIVAQSCLVSSPSPPPITSGGNPLAGGSSDLTILRHLISFAARDGFLFVAGVSKSWRDAWGVERAPGTTIDAAVQSPSRLGWARASGLDWGSNVCARAAAGGHLSTLRYARAVGCPWDWRTCANAATRVSEACVVVSSSSSSLLLLLIIFVFAHRQKAHRRKSTLAHGEKPRHENLSKRKKHNYWMSYTRACLVCVCVCFVCCLVFLLLFYPPVCFM